MGQKTLILLDWTEIMVADRFTQLVGRISSRMFGGTALSRHDDWVNTTITFAVDGFIGAQKIKKFPHFLRPIAAKFIPEIAKIKNHYKLAHDLLIPMLEERERKGEKHLDLLQWMSENAKGEETEKQYIADIQLKVSFAAIHTSAAAPTQLIYDMCAMPEIIEPLREELKIALEQEGSLTKAALNMMPKMDSFMKESQRFNPLLLSTPKSLLSFQFGSSLTDPYLTHSNNGAYGPRRLPNVGWLYHSRSYQCRRPYPGCLHGPQHLS